MKIAMLGHRGIPANFGGSETAVEEIGSRLVERGHQVTVYCRRHNSNYSGKYYKGMERVVLPSVNTLSLDLMSHTFISLMNMVGREFDVVHFHGVGNALQFPFFKLTRAKSLLVVDGFDWRRPKWGTLARIALRTSFPMAVFWADEIISDNLLVQKFFREKYGRETPLVGYGADLEKPTTKTALEEFGLKPSKYILQVAAIVPDKGVHTLVEAYEKLETDLPLVIVGDTPYMTKYKAQVLSTKDRRIKFLGYIYGTRYRELLANCYMYIHPLLADGTSPALLQAMAYGCCVIASDLPEMGWSLSNCGPKFPPGDVGALRQQIAYLLENPEETKKYGNMARQRILDNFTWERITDQYEELSQKLLHQN